MVQVTPLRRTLASSP